VDRDWVLVLEKRPVSCALFGVLSSTALNTLKPHRKPALLKNKNPIAVHASPRGGPADPFHALS
jgi:hypothetical protein